MHCCAWVAAEARVISASVALSSATFVRVEEVVGIVAVLVRCAMGLARCVRCVLSSADTGPQTEEGNRSGEEEEGSVRQVEFRAGFFAAILARGATR